jgi:hypothetical protein
MIVIFITNKNSLKGTMTITYILIYLAIVNIFLNIKKITIENIVKDDVKSKVGWLKKRGFLLVIELVIDECNYLKLKDLNKLSSLTALNWPINISNSYNSNISTIKTFGVHLIGQCTCK